MKPGPRPKFYIRQKSLREKWAEKYSPKSFLVDKERFEEQKISDVPVLRLYDGTVVCIPHRNEPNNIAMVGKKGTGKTILINRIASEIFWLWGENVIIMNDIQEECFEWSKYLKNVEWRNQLSMIGENSIPLPMVYVFPHTDSLKKIKCEDNYVQITMPFSEIIKNADIYLKMGNSGRYVREYTDELLRCEVPEDVTNLMEEKFPGKQNRAMREKILAGFEDVFNEEIVDITNPQFPSVLSCGDIKGNPLVVLSKIGVVPCFETSNLFPKRYMPEVIAHHLNEIFKSKYDGELLENEIVYVVFDELTHIAPSDDENEAYKSLCTIASRGRKLGIGLIYATQNYSKIPRKIKVNTDYVFAFQHTNDEEVNRIKKDFDLGKLTKEDIFHLKTFEVVAITNEHFVLYKEGERWEEGGAFRGEIIPPQANHFSRYNE